MAQGRRGPVLTIFAVLFLLLAVSNLSKPFQVGGTAGFVFFGQRLSGMANAILGPLFGIYLAVYAIGILRMKRFAIPMAHAYATYIMLNLILFHLSNPAPQGVDQVIFVIVYAVIAIGVSLAAAILLTQRKAELT